jgi:uracil-DNA glycosylase family 4
VETGLLERAHPVFSGRSGQRIMLVGQAPGPVEDDVTRPFAGRAGAHLMRWLASAGFADEATVRERVFMTSMTTCFPGRLPGNGGDRRPSAREVAQCSSWLNAYVELLAPALIICIGTLAQSRFIPGHRLEQIVGRSWTPDGAVVDGPPARRPILLPLPHPSGQSRWLNDPGHLELLASALRRLHELVEWAESTPA